MTHNPNILEAGEVGNPVSFHWEVIDKCQFECTYCYATDFNKNDFFTKQLYHQSYKLVLHRLQKFDFDFEVDLLGGEPTLHPHLVDIIGTLEKMEHCKRINLYTNFSARLTYYKQLDVENSKLTLCLSYHAEYHRRILKKYLALHSVIHHLNMFVEVNLYPKRKYFGQICDMLHKLKEHNIPFGVNTVRDNTFWDCVVDDGFEEEFGEYLRDVEINQLARSIKHLTTTGMEYLDENYIIQHNINYQGYSCEALAYKIQVDGDIINACSYKRIPLDADQSIFTDSIVCPRDTTCSCPDMLYYKKVQCE